MPLLRQLNAAILRVANWGVIITMAGIAIVIPMEVFGRYVLNQTSVWSAEFAQYAFVWATMLAGAIGLKKGYQVGITSLIESLSPGPAKVVQLLGFAVMLVFLSLMTYYGIEQMMTNTGQVSSSMGLNMSIPYAALPIGFFIMLLITIEQLADFLTANLSGSGKGK